MSRAAAWGLLGLVLAVPAQAVTPAARQCAVAAADGAVETCRRAAAENPKDIAVLRHLARSLVAIGEFEGAVDVQRTIVTLRPEDAAAHYDLAGTLGFIRLYAEAVQPIETAIRLAPGDIAARQVAAVLYFNSGRAPEAVAHTGKAAALGDARSMYDMFRYTRDGIGVAADPGQAFAWLDRAARGGHVKAMALLVDVYLEGLYGQVEDIAKAKDWARRARAQRLGE